MSHHLQPCQHHLYQHDNPEQPESSSDHEGYDASSEESDSEDTPSIISDKGITILAIAHYH